MSILVQVDRFEGPLALLLHLIRKEEMDIFDINVHQITQQYMEYIRAMKQLDLELAGEFVAMAATLIHIKSKMLLPQYNEEGEEIEAEDPRKELVQRLLEYQAFQEAAKKLYQRPLLGRDFWSRGLRESIQVTDEGELILEDNPLFSLITAYRFAMKGMKKAVHKVAGELQSISSRILEIKDRLIVGQRIIFKDLIDQTEMKSNQVLVTFLSMLELAKMGFVSLFQSENFADIHIDTKRPVDRDVISRVESYDAQAAAEVAAHIMEEAEVRQEVLALDEATGDADEAEASSEENLFAAATDEEILAEELAIEEEAPMETAEAEVAVAETAVAETKVDEPAAPETTPLMREPIFRREEVRDEAGSFFFDMKAAEAEFDRDEMPKPSDELADMEEPMHNEETVDGEESMHSSDVEGNDGEVTT